MCTRKTDTAIAICSKSIGIIIREMLSEYGTYGAVQKSETANEMKGREKTEQTHVHMSLGVFCMHAAFDSVESLKGSLLLDTLRITRTCVSDWEFPSRALLN